jgi:hypothetical protein
MVHRKSAIALSTGIRCLPQSLRLVLSAPQFWRSNTKLSRAMRTQAVELFDLLARD